MKKILILGAGLVSRPLVKYLLDRGIKLLVASRTVSKAEDLIEGHPDGEALAFDIVKNPSLLDELVPRVDLVISLLPYTYHVQVAEACLRFKKHMVTTSYVSEKMDSLNNRAKEAKVILLNEIGVDPGIDHMSAMKVIHHVQKNGGKIKSFRSYCGGLPAPDANTKPFGYKFSWSPRGVLMAGKNSARYLEDGKEVFIPGEELFDHYKLINIEGVGELEGYPNRNSLPYIEKYGIRETETMFRGTFRYPGWCRTLKKIAETGYLKEEKIDGLSELTFRGLTSMLTGLSHKNLKHDLTLRLDIEEDSLVMHNLEWLGLLSDESIPENEKTPLDVLVARMLQKLQYERGERDMLILYHEFIAHYKDRKEKITSTLIDFGIPHGDSSMSRTVGLPAAIASRFILEGKFNMSGVVIPVIPEIYEPVLKELEGLNIVCKEKYYQI
ncbi:MAG TPA: saccharopine dehydrogenase C-terminal domain-containing protein [Candidatus Eremiobacteraeota bacterium]|nr:saccharopine dehydrogenase C-terminal domain-containing protein [Candidatus Eremiobacteraeota bacterium]